MELNKENLRRAIDHLPEYQPPEGLWEDLAEQLDFEGMLEVPLQQMPEYAPPTAVWEALAERVEQTPELKPKSRDRVVLRWFVGALLLAISIGWWMFQPAPAAPAAPAIKPVRPIPSEPLATSPQNTASPMAQTQTKPPKTVVPPRPEAKISHRTEAVDIALIMACQRADDPNFDIVETLCREALPVCEEPQFKQLKTALDDLTHAHSELKNALGDFADDPEMIAQLIEIEHARHQILQQLIAMM